jgi:excisionase family DNA binding protein
VHDVREAPGAAEHRDLEQLLTYAQIQGETNVPKSYWERLVAERRIRHIKRGRTNPILIPRSAVAAHLAECERPAMADTTNRG